MTRIEALLAEVIGLDAATVGPHVIDSAIRACAGGLDADAYAARLSDPREMERLIAAVVVPESSFFRDPASFEYLREFALRKPFLRVLSIPCAAGEEPYSIAATLLDCRVKFTIDAVDIRPNALCSTFRPSAFRNDLALYMRERWFDGYTVRRELRDPVRFHCGNLLDPSLLAGETFDVIFCKNLLIYFTAEARSRAVAQLQRLLAPGGLLFVGASEIGWLHGNGAFAAVDTAAMALWSAVAPAAALHRGDASRRAAARAAAIESGSSRYRTPDLAEARLLAGRGLLDEAQAIVARCAPSDESYALLGVIAFARGDDAQGRGYLERALYLNPDNVEALTLLAIENERDGDDDTATRLRNRARRAEGAHAG
ncbi:MAG TPA: CheR family methyltransferase [Thermoanaerobaculia bacterium]|nr:CheR family methyltransferase [Thermoanaerobaculia bacterium]